MTRFNRSIGVVMRGFSIGQVILETIATIERLENHLYSELGSQHSESVYLFDKIARLHKAKIGLVSLMAEYPGL